MNRVSNFSFFLFWLPKLTAQNLALGDSCCLYQLFFFFISLRSSHNIIIKNNIIIEMFQFRPIVIIAVTLLAQQAVASVKKEKYGTRERELSARFAAEGGGKGKGKTSGKGKGSSVLAETTVCSIYESLGGMSCSDYDPALLAVICPTQDDLCDPSLTPEKWCTEQYPSCSPTDSCCSGSFPQLPPLDGFPIDFLSDPTPSFHDPTISVACPIFITECCPTTCCDKPKVDSEIIVALLSTLPADPKAFPVCDFDFNFELCPCLPEPDDFVIDSQGDLELFVNDWCFDLLFGDKFDGTLTMDQQAALDTCMEYVGGCCALKGNFIKK